MIPAKFIRTCYQTQKHSPRRAGGTGSQVKFDRLIGLALCNLIVTINSAAGTFQALFERRPNSIRSFSQGFYISDRSPPKWIICPIQNEIKHQLNRSINCELSFNDYLRAELVAPRIQAFLPVWAKVLMLRFLGVPKLEVTRSQSSEKSISGSGVLSVDVGCNKRQRVECF